MFYVLFSSTFPLSGECPCWEPQRPVLMEQPAGILVSDCPFLESCVNDIGNNHQRFKASFAAWRALWHLTCVFGRYLPTMTGRQPALVNKGQMLLLYLPPRSELCVKTVTNVVLRPLSAQCSHRMSNGTFTLHAYEKQEQNLVESARLQIFITSNFVELCLTFTFLNVHLHFCP